MSKDSQHLHRLYCFDWDKTITRKHMCADIPPLSKNFDCPQAYVYGYVASEQIPTEMEPKDNLHTTLQTFGLQVINALIYKQEIQNIIENAYDKGIKVAIVTFNHHPDLIFEVLKQLMIREEVLKSMVIIFGGDSDTNKNLHLEGAMQYFHIPKKEEVLFVDDAVKNIKYAQKLGYNCLEADKKQLWIQKVTEYITQTETFTSPKETIAPVQKTLDLNREFINPDSELNKNLKVISKASETKSCFYLKDIPLKRKIWERKEADSDSTETEAESVSITKRTNHPSLAILEQNIKLIEEMEEPVTPISSLSCLDYLPLGEGASPDLI